jgi:ribonuclease P protein component
LGLRKDLRLRRRADFDAVFKGGRIFADGLLVLRALPNELGHNRYGFVTSKKLGGAVVRNRTRRRLREIARESQGWSPRHPGQDMSPAPQAPPVPEPPTGYDVVLSAKTAAAGAEFAALRESVRRLMAKGGLAGEGTRNREQGTRKADGALREPQDERK